LLENFVSNETNHKYKAYVALERIEGNLSFEFELMAAKAPARTAGKRLRRRRLVVGDGANRINRCRD
jgi:hypothetical protein